MSFPYSTAFYITCFPSACTTSILIKEGIWQWKSTADKKLLGLLFKDVLLPSLTFKLPDELLLLESKCIVLKWIQKTPPTVTLWYKEICNVLPHDKIGSVHKDNEQSFLDIWTMSLLRVIIFTSKGLSFVDLTTGWNTGTEHSHLD